MDMFEKVQGHCQLRNCEVEILYVTLKKGKSKNGVKTPVRCQNAGECPRSSFCKFVNPLTTHFPVDMPAAVNGEATAV